MAAYVFTTLKYVPAPLSRCKNIHSMYTKTRETSEIPRALEIYVFHTMPYESQKEQSEANHIFPNYYENFRQQKLKKMPFSDIKSN